MGLGGFVKKVFTSVKLTKRDYDPKQLSITDINLPLFTRGKTQKQLQTVVDDVLDSMKLLNYNKSTELSATIEWNSYTISMLLKIYKDENDKWVLLQITPKLEGGKLVLETREISARDNVTLKNIIM